MFPWHLVLIFFFLLCMWACLHPCQDLFGYLFIVLIDRKCCCTFRAEAVLWDVFVNAVQAAESLKYNFTVRYDRKLKTNFFNKSQPTHTHTNWHTIVDIVCIIALDLLLNRNPFCLCFIRELEQQTRRIAGRAKEAHSTFSLCRTCSAVYSLNLSGEVDKTISF